MFSFKPITNTEVAILDQSGQNTQHIRNQLAASGSSDIELMIISLSANDSFHLDL